MSYAWDSVLLSLKLLGEIGIEFGPWVFEQATWPILFPFAFFMKEGCRLEKWVGQRL